MPELPEVEVIKLGLTRGLTNATVLGTEVRDERALKRHTPIRGSRAEDFERRLVGVRFAEPKRRGKFLWLPLQGASSGFALLAHLGMSGQLLLRTLDQPDDRHVRVRIWIEHPTSGELRLDFSDQRLFGSLALDRLTMHSDDEIPGQVTHIARDPLDPLFDRAQFLDVLKRRSSAIKTVILNQSVLSGVGNIYADEALWAARIHPETSAQSVSGVKAKRLLDEICAVFEKALAEGGTSFDALFVNVNGESGYFAHSLNAYGRKGQPCPRCGTPIKRIAFANRGSHFCPRCQRR